MIVDVMPTDPEILGFSNPWHSEAVATVSGVTLPSPKGEPFAIRIRLISARCFVATKIEAFLGRGRNDFCASHDIEDIVTIVNGRREITQEIGDDAYSLFVARTFRDWLALPRFPEALEGHLSEQGRWNTVLRRFKAVAAKCDKPR